MSQDQISNDEPSNTTNQIELQLQICELKKENLRLQRIIAKLQAKEVSLRNMITALEERPPTIEIVSHIPEPEPLPKEGEK